MKLLLFFLMISALISACHVTAKTNYRYPRYDHPIPQFDTIYITGMVVYGGTSIGIVIPKKARKDSIIYIHAHK